MAQGMFYRGSSDHYSDHRGRRGRGGRGGIARGRRWATDRHAINTDDATSPEPVADWSAEVMAEERQASGYLTDSVLTGRGRGYRRGRGRARYSTSGYLNRRDSDYENYNYRGYSSMLGHSQLRATQPFDDDDRDFRSRRRMTDDDDTVLDNASVNSQDLDDRRRERRRRRRKNNRGGSRGSGGFTSGTETDTSVSNYRGGGNRYSNMPPRGRGSFNSIPHPQPQQPSAGRGDAALYSGNKNSVNNGDKVNGSDSNVRDVHRPPRDIPREQRVPRTRPPMVPKGATQPSGSDSDTKLAKVKLNNPSKAKDQMVNGE